MAPLLAMAPTASSFLQGMLPVASLLPGLLLRSSPAAAFSAFGGTRATLQVNHALAVNHARGLTRKP
jgi:hypothetical protein